MLIDYLYYRFTVARSGEACHCVIAALIFDVVSVWQGQQKSRLNELVTFAAVYLLAPLAYTVSLGRIDQIALALWVLNTLFFFSAIFTVKLRKTKTASIIPGIIFHGIATAIVVILWLTGWLSPITASAFGVALVKFMLILVKFYGKFSR